MRKRNNFFDSTILGIVATISFTISGIFFVISEHKITAFVFTLVGIFITLMALHYAFVERHKNKYKYFSYYVGIVIIPFLVYAAKRLSVNDEEKKPDLYFEFNNSESFFFTILNKGGVAAKLPRYWFVLMDSETSELVQFPANEFSYIQAYGRYGSRSDLQKFLKPYHHYIGIAGVICENCEGIKIYVLSFLYGKKGDSWYMPFDREKLPKIQFKNSKSLTPKELEEILKIQFPVKERIKF